MPVTDKIDVGFSFGPTIFMVGQDVATAITVTEPTPTLASTTITREHHRWNKPGCRPQLLLPS